MTQPDWENELRAVLARPGPPGHYWHRPTDWTIEQVVELVRRLLAEEAQP